jgi:DNA-binding beta-propeller fold protein YncE
MPVITTRRALRRKRWTLLLLGLSGCAAGAPAANSGMGDAASAPEHTPTLSVAARDPSTLAPLDATPSPDGSRIYYLAIAQDDANQLSPGVFSVATDSSKGTSIEKLAIGAPLVAPVAIASALDGSDLYIADPTGRDDATGTLLRMSVTDGSLTELPGTAGYHPTGLVVGELEGAQWLYFTGRDPDNGEPGLYRLAPGAGLVEPVARFAFGVEPGGVALASNGDAYVAANSSDGAQVLQVRGGQATRFVQDIALGFPAGVALTRDDQTLLVSGLDPETRRDVVYVVNVASGQVTRLTAGLGQFHESAGLHRAHRADVFAWADSQAGDSGTVYAVKL